MYNEYIVIIEVVVVWANSEKVCENISWKKKEVKMKEIVVCLCEGNEEVLLSERKKIMWKKWNM